MTFEKINQSVTASQLRKLRQELRLSLQEASAGLGYSRTTLGRIEREERDISTAETLKILKYYKVYSLLKTNYYRAVNQYYILRHAMKGKHFAINTTQELSFLFLLLRSYVDANENSPRYTELAQALHTGPLYLYMGVRRIIFSPKEPPSSERQHFGDLLDSVKVLLDDFPKTSGITSPADHTEETPTPSPSSKELDIRSLRVKAKATLQEVAGALGLPTSSYGYMERGERRFPKEKEQQARIYLEKKIEKAARRTSTDQ